MSSDLLRRKSPHIFDQIIEGALYLLFFLVPIFFLPWTSNLLDINKQMLLVVLAVIALVAWFGKMVFSKQLLFKVGWINIVPGLFLGSVLVSAILSLSTYQTWVGQASQEYVSFLSTAMFVFLFYLIMNTADKTVIQRNSLFALLLSAGLTGLITFLGMFDIYHLPFSFASSIGFNTVGTMNGFILFMSVVMYLGLAMWLVSKDGRYKIVPTGGFGTFLKFLIVLVTIVNLSALMVIDYWLFWVINIIGVFLLSGFGFVQEKEFPNVKRFFIPIVILFLSILFLFLPSPMKVQVPLVVSPSYTTSWGIVKKTLDVNKKQMMFGSGPGTFLYDYVAYKPVTVNESRFWSMRFDRAKSSFLTQMANIGLLGSLLWLVFMLWIGAKSLGRLLFERDHGEWKMTYVIFVGWALLLVSQFLYSSNFTLHFLLWALTGLLASQVALKSKKTDFDRSPRIGLVTSFVFVVVCIGLIMSLFVTVQRFAADANFAKAVSLDRSGASIDLVVEKLNRAVKYNDASDRYYRNLSSALLKQTRAKIVSYNAAEFTPEQTQEITGLVQAAVFAANKATEIEPNFVANWSTLGSVYRELMSFAQGAEELSAKAFTNTIRIEPNNPLNRANLGRVYLTVAERVRKLKTAESKELRDAAALQEEELLKGAEESFNAAIQLKGDYLPAHYYLAATYERQGRLEDATNRMLALRNNSLSDVGLGFQLSQLLMRMDRNDLAKQELERIVAINPNYSNGLWYLASIYELESNRAKAVELVGKVVENNPNNELAKNRLQRLRSGEITTVIPEPIQLDDGVETSEGDAVEGLPEAEEVIAE
jgi:tetratricopeptide (TPR) repeat protein